MKKDCKTTPWMAFMRALLLIALIAPLLSACQTWQIEMNPPAPLRPAKPEPAPQRDSATKTVRAGVAKTGFSAAPKPPAGPSIAGQSYQEKPIELAGEPLQINIESLPMAAFIDEIFGNLLKQSYEIAPGIEKRKDLVTLRLATPVAPSDLYRLAENILQNYGVEIDIQEHLMRFTTFKGAPSGEPPLLISGRTLPEVPVSHRPIFHIVPLHSVLNSNVRAWLEKAYAKQELKIAEDPKRNAIILIGPPPIVAQALEAISVLDQPNMRGRHSLRINPAFRTPTELSDALVTVLLSEGYSASNRPPIGSILVIPLEQSGAVLVFAANQALIEHTRQWAAALDQPDRNNISSRLFYYPVRKTRAADIADTLNRLMGEFSASPTGKPTPAKAENASQAFNSQQPKLVVDETRNALLFHGSSHAWSELLPVIIDMDKPAKQVLIEVTIAEVTLTEDDQFGIEWLLTGAIGNYTQSAGTLGGLGVGSPAAEGGLSGGFTYTLSSAGQTRLVLNALASNQRVNILSTPRIMVKSGQEASIEVGTEVPIITSQATGSDLPSQGGGSSILQNIQYRKTGVLLSVSPIIHAGQRVDLEIAQEISAAQVNQTSGVDSPTILNRKVNTSLSLRDGGSVVLGGMISSDGSTNSRGIPGLMDLPLLGKLFRSDTRSKVRTELLVLVIPYIISNAEEAESITQDLKDRLHRQPSDSLPEVETRTIPPQPHEP
jgi:general secretion pathway protein D